MEPNQIWLLFVVNLILTRHFLHIWFCRRLYMLRSVWLVVCAAQKKNQRIMIGMLMICYLFIRWLYRVRLIQFRIQLRKQFFFFIQITHSLGKKGHRGQKWREPCYLFAKNKMIHAVKMVLSIHLFINRRRNLVKTIKKFETFK